MSNGATMQLPDTLRDIAGVTLSREELYVVLRLLKANAMPGFDSSWAPLDASGQPAGEAIASAQMGIDALIARGYLSIIPSSTPDGQPHLEVPSPVLALVGICAFSPFTARIAAITHGVLREYYIHQLDRLGAIHTSLMPHVHMFTPLDGRAGVLKAIVALVGADAPGQGGGQLGVIPLDAMSAAVNAARDHAIPDVRAALGQASGIDTGTLRDLETTLAHDPLWAQLTFGARDASGAVVQRSVFTLSAAGASYLFPPQPEDPRLLAIFAGGSKRITDWLVAQLPPSAV